MTDATREHPLEHYTKLAEKGRQEMNGLTDLQREMYSKKAFALIYGDSKATTVNTNRR